MRREVQKRDVRERKIPSENRSQYSEQKIGTEEEIRTQETRTDQKYPHIRRK